MDSDDEDMLTAAYALDGPDANRALYARWAATYEDGFVADTGYRYPEQVARVFAEHCLPGIADGTVVDIGCGTGLAGLALALLRHVALDGVDISAEMLAVAGEKAVGGAPVYRRLVEGDLTARLPIADHHYDGALSSGTFTHGHLGPEALHEVVRLVRPGGRLALGVNAAHFTESGFAEVLDELAADGRITELRFVDVPVYDDTDLDDANRVGRVAVFTIGSAG